MKGLIMSLFAGIVLLAATAGSEADTIESKETARATFAGGCFWCMEYPFDKMEGVISTTSGYIGGHYRDPTYEDITTGRTGHAEAVEVLYDPEKISYDKLLEVFWRNVDPTTADRQFCDKGYQYRTAIYYHNEEQEKLAKESKVAVEKNKSFVEPVVTEITKATEFYPAEEYHQDFYEKNPIRYKFYRYRCGRDARIRELWGKEAHKGIEKH